MNYIVTDNKNRFFLIVSLCLVHLLLGLDINIVSISLPVLSQSFSISINEVSRVVWIYFLVVTSFLLLFGKLGDRFGFKKLFNIGIIVFLLGSFFAGISPDYNFLIVARIVQASGGAVLFALSPALISAYIPPEMRGRIYGFNYAFVALGGIIGRGLSGYIIGMFGWSSIFLINIPIGLITIALTLKYIPSQQTLNKEVRFDIQGAVYIFIGLLAFLFSINNGNDFGWNSYTILSGFFISIVFFVLFYIRENRFSFPLLDLTFFKNKNFIFASVAFMFIYLLTNGMVFIFPFYLQWGRGLSINESGLLMVIPSVMQVISGSISGHLSDKIGCKKICIAGIIMTIAAYILFYISGSFSGIYMIVISVALFGIAIGTFIPSNTNMIMAYAPEDKKGIISSIMITINRAGSALGVCFYGAIFSIFVPEKSLIKILPVESLMKGFKYTFIFGIIIAIASLIFSSIAKDEKKIH